jgi:hypothetical protein
MNEWTWGDSARLVGRAYCWLVGVTVPAVTIAWTVAIATISAVQGRSVAGWTAGADVGITVVVLIWMNVVIDIAALVGAVVALPCTFVLGLLLRRVRSRALHIVAAAALAGALSGVAAGSTWALGDGGSALMLGAPIGVAAAAAAAIARWRQLVVAARETSAFQPWPPAMTP